jgi:putative ABC transport system permease protein
MIGMIIGVASIVLLVSIGNGVKNYILAEFEGLGTNLIIVQPGKTDKKRTLAPPMGAAQRPMTPADVTALETRARTLEAVTGLVFGSVTAKFEVNSSNVNVFGSNEQLLDILNLSVGEGSYFTREEDEFGRRVAVLGKKVAINLLGDAAAVGRTVKLNQSEYRVIGVMAQSGDKLGINLDEIVFIPTTAALRLFNDNKLFGIRAKARSRNGITDAVDEIAQILRERRDGEEDFTILTQVAMMDTIGTILSMLTYVLGGIAAISMLVAGIGIMNIMLVSVAERTSEIGIRRAVGARQRDILRQFLTEAAALSTLGGGVGLLLAIALTHLVYYYVPKFDLRAPLWISAPAFLLSVSLGIIFGLLPAIRAARIEPLDALRHE